MLFLDLYDEKHSYRINEMLTKGVYEATEKATGRLFFVLFCGGERLRKSERERRRENEREIEIV